jgi:hypothetical protein
VILPQTFESGFTVQFDTETETGSRIISSSATFARNSINYGNTAFDHNVTYVKTVPALNEILYTTTDESVLSTSISGLVSNTYENGVGIMSFDHVITSIPNYSFRQKHTLKSISLPESVETIGRLAFNMSESLTTVVLREGITKLENSAFAACEALSEITLPNSLCELEDGVFYECSSLTQINIPSNIEDIPDGTFSGCRALTSFTLPEGILSIGEGAFYACRISELDIPESVVSIGSGAFSGCLSLSSITIHASIPPAGSAYMFDGSDGAPILVPKGSVDAYKLAPYWSSYANRIQAIPEAVDLGLSVKWASWNVGASTAEEYGSYFAWGETSIKCDYVDSTYKLWEFDSNSYTIYKYNTQSFYGTVDNRIILESEDDVATTRWGYNWRTPTIEEWMELAERCSWTWSTINGTNGYLVSSTTTGNSIFLPAAGYYFFDTLENIGQQGYYWSSSLREELPLHAWYLSFKSSNIEEFYNGRAWGKSIRPVNVE